MIISEKEKIIFFHNPKAAGTTIINNLVNTNGFELITKSRYGKKILNNPKYKKFTLEKIISMCEEVPQKLDELERKLNEVKLCEGSITELKTSNLIDFSKYFKFCFVRNPYSWRYSAWRQHIEAFTQWAHPNYIFAHRLQIKEQYLEFNNYPNILDIGLYNPQHFFTHIEGKLQMDFIGKTETFTQDWLRLVTSKPSLPFAIERTNSRNSKCEDYLQYFTSETVELVNDLYDNDFKLLGYEKLNPKEFPKSLPSIPYNPVLPS